MNSVKDIMEASYVNPGVYDGNNFRKQYWEPPADYQRTFKRETEKDHSDDESIDSTRSKKSLGKICVRFAEKTSMVGVPYINSARLMAAKITWSVLLLIFIGAMTFHLWYLCDQFFDYPKQTKISLGFDNLKYPAITVCNVNVIRKSKLDQTSPGLQRLVDAVNPEQFKPSPPTAGANSGSGSNPEQFKPSPPTAGANSGSGSNPNSGSSSSQQQRPLRGRRKRFVQQFRNINFNNYSQDTNYKKFGPMKGSRSPVYQVQETFEDLYMKHSRATRIRVGHDINDMLVSCSFNGYECYAKNFTLTNHPGFGNCYTLYTDQYLAMLSGPKYGFSIELYTEIDEYLAGITQGYGARVIIHDGDTFPFPEDEGMYSPSGWESQIGLALIDITRLDGLYGNCDNGVEFFNKYNITYTRRTCQLICQQIDLTETCGCVDKTDQEIFYRVGRQLTKICANSTEMECLNDVLQQYVLKEKSCNCPNPCNEQLYKVTTSYRQWPTEDYTSTLMQSVCENMPSKCDHVQGLEPAALSRNFIKLTVYYEDLNYELIEENPEIEPQQFASDVGGAIGLWIGLSLLSIFEVVQLFCELCRFGCHKCTTVERDTKSSRRYCDNNSSEKTLDHFRNSGQFVSYPQDPQYRKKR